MTKSEVEELRDLRSKQEDLKAKRAELRKLITEHRDSLSDEDLGNYKAQAQEIKDALEKVNSDIKAAESRTAMDKGENMNYLEQRNEVLEKRAEQLVKSDTMTLDSAFVSSEMRAELLSSGTLKPLSNQVDINDIANNGVSGILNDIYIQDLKGTGGNEVPYVASESAADVGTEGVAPTESEPAFGIVKMTPVTVNTIAYVSRRIKKLTPVAYEAKVRSLALKALRKKVINLISTGAAGTKSGNDITVSGVEGIVNSTLVTAKNITAAIGPTTLRDIVLAYGGDDEVSGAAVLQLCKADLQAFGAVRGTNEKKAVYEITVDPEDPNTGFIKDGGTIAKYRINSNLTANTMIYGQLPHYELDTFGNYEIRVSEDFKFDKGLLAIKGEVEVAGAVVSKGGFLKVVTNYTAGD